MRSVNAIQTSINQTPLETTFTYFRRMDQFCVLNNLSPPRIVAEMFYKN